MTKEIREMIHVLNDFTHEVSQADFKVFDMYEYDEYLYMDTSLGIFCRKIEGDIDEIEYDIVRALESFNCREDFITFGWVETDYNI